MFDILTMLVHTIRHYDSSYAATSHAVRVEGVTGGFICIVNTRLILTTITIYITFCLKSDLTKDATKSAPSVWEL